MTKSPFTAQTSHYWDGSWKETITIRQYVGDGTSNVIEGRGGWKSRVEAQAVCDLLNAGGKVADVKWASYADD